MYVLYLSSALYLTPPSGHSTFPSPKSIIVPSLLKLILLAGLFLALIISLDYIYLSLSVPKIKIKLESFQA